VKIFLIFFNCCYAGGVEYLMIFKKSVKTEYILSFELSVRRAALGKYSRKAHSVRELSADGLARTWNGQPGPQATPLSESEFTRFEN